MKIEQNYTFEKIEMKDRVWLKEHLVKDVEFYKKYLVGVNEMFAFVMPLGFKNVVVRGFDDLNACLKFQKQVSITGCPSLVYHVSERVLVSYLTGVVRFEFDGL